jgi:hypothetical protein
MPVRRSEEQSETFETRQADSPAGLISKLTPLAAELFELRWWLLALVIYVLAMGHLEGIDPAKPEKMRIVKHSLVSGLGAFALASLGLTRRRYLPEATVIKGIWAATIMMLLLMSKSFVISHIAHPAALVWMRGLIYLAAVSVLVAYPLSARGYRTAAIGALLTSVGLLLLARTGVLVVSPHPNIDVFTLAKEASRALWRGENPYAADYSNLYAGTKLDLGYSPGYNYFPTMLLTNALSDRMFGDVRAGYVFAEWLTAFFIARLVRGLGWSMLVAVSVTALWCANSLSFQVLEKWNDSIVLAATLGLLAMLAERRWLLAGVAFGLGAASKQYLPLAFLPIAVWLWNVAPPGGLKRFLWGVGLSAGVVCLPFLLNHGDWFLARTLLHFARTPFRDDSISLLNFARIILGFSVDSPLIRVSPYIGLTIGLGIALSIVARSRPASPDRMTASLDENVHRLLVALLFVWAGFFHFIKQSFLNYYYFLFSLCVLLMITMVRRAKRLDGGTDA